MIGVSQAPFIKDYGGTDTEIPWHLIQTLDSGFVMVGSTRTFGIGNQNMYLIKTDKKGDTMWTKASSHIYGGAGMDVQLTKENNLLVSGVTRDGNAVAQLMKFDIQGNIIWAKGIVPNLGGFAAIKRVDDIKSVLFGDNIDSALSYQLRFMLIDSSGAVLATKSYGTTNSEQFTDCVVLNSGFVITGGISCTPWPQLSYIFLMKLDSLGNIIWSRRYDNSPICNIYPGNLILTNDGGYVLTGGYTSDILLMRTDSLGNLLWSKKYDSGFGDFSSKLILMPDNGYLIAGYSNNSNTTNKTQICLIRTNSSGDTLWTKKIGDPQHINQLRDIIRTYSGNYALLSQSDAWSMNGNGDYDFSLILLDSLLHSNCYEYAASTIVSNVTLHDSSFIMPTYNHIEQVNAYHPVFVSGGNTSEWCTIPTEIISETKNGHDNFTLYPNPAKEELFISYNLFEECNFELYGILGSKKRCIAIEDKMNIKKIALSELETGLYFYRIVDKKNAVIKNGKIIIIK